MSSSPPAWPSLEELRAPARFGIMLAVITFVAIETAAAIARGSRG